MIDEIIGDNSPDTLPPVHLIPKIDLAPHTLFLLCGPTSSGKSQFAEDISNVASIMHLNCNVISSDQLRQQVLRNSDLAPFAAWPDGDRYSSGMMAASRSAFDLLEAELRAATRFPTQSEIIIMDTTGMSEDFRKSVLNEGHNNGYKVVLVTFEYKNRSDYFPPGASDVDKAIIESSVIRFRRKVLPALNAREFDARIRIKSRLEFGWDLPRDDSWWFEDSITTWEDNVVSESAKQKIELYQHSRIDRSNSSVPDIYAVIGDSHECVGELDTLIKACKGAHPGCRIVHVGDYLDKGGDTLNMLTFMTERLKEGDIVIQGNHESYVHKRLTKEIDENLELEKANFTSLEVLLTNEVGKAQFLAIWAKSLPFAILGDFDEAGCVPAFVTHAPCRNSDLGKIHDKALRNQRNYRIKDRSIDAFKELDWLYKEAEKIFPLHIFGHVSHSLDRVNSTKPVGTVNLAYKNKVFLDTGAVYGGYLSAVIVTKGTIINTLHIKSRARVEATLPIRLQNGPATGKAFNLADYDLELRDLRLIESVMVKGVKFISGTMSPSASTQTELEPLHTALRWFKERGATSVVLQPKYMGSRCQLYLFKDSPEKTFAVSRGGWVIKGVEGLDDAGYKAFLEAEHVKYKELMDACGDTVLDGELLPWAALGSGLIEDQFTGYQELVKYELGLLAVDEGFAALGEFKNKFDVTARQGDIAKFEEVLGRYSKFGPPEFKPFSVLSRSIRSDSDGSFSGNVHGFNRINTDQFYVLSLATEPGKDIEVPQGVLDFYSNLTVEKGMEGVVVKPYEGECELPYLKVRSPEYLRLVYGYDYTREERYQRLCRQKNVSGKVRTSITEYKLGMQMLKAGNDDLKKELVVKMIGQMKFEKTLDPRL
jgi:predicted kinase